MKTSSADPEGTHRQRHERSRYSPTWWEVRFPWLLDLIAALDPEPLSAEIGRRLAPIRHGVETLSQPLASALTAIGLWGRTVADRGVEVVGRGVRALPLPRPVRRGLWLESPLLLAGGTDSAQAVLKRQHARVLPLAIIVAVLAHAGVLVLAPAMRPADLGADGQELMAVELPPDVEIPPPPEPIARPATPIIATTFIDQEVTIPPTTFDQFTDVALPPPPEPVETPARGAPSFTPFTVAPSVLNADELRELMVQEYPPLLREAGIGGTVRIWAYIDAQGVVQDARIAESSGHGSLDQTALSVAMSIRCSPALNRDIAIPVWIQMPLEFSSR